MKARLFGLICFVIFPLVVHSAEPPFVVTHVSSDGVLDKRNQYEIDLLTLLLSKTENEYGRYELVPAPAGSSHLRALEYMRQNLRTNFIRSFAYSHDREKYKELTKIDFPIYLGIVGYRICFVSSKIKTRVASARSIFDLREFSHIQGVGWLDAKILRNAGFTVRELPDYESLFNIIAHNRADLFCRGVQEFLNEYKDHQHIEGLELNDTFAFFYPYPLYFYTNSKNVKLRTRIQKGLDLSLSDGSFYALWNDYFLESINHANLSQRLIIDLNNPTLTGLENNYQRYFYRPKKIFE